MMPPLTSPVSWLADTSLRVSAAIVLAMLLRPWLRRWIGNRAAPWLWLIVAARLLLPWPVESRWSLPERWPAPLEKSSEAAVAGGLTVRVSVAPAGGRNAIPPPPPLLSLMASRWHGWNFWNALWALGAAAAAATLLRGWMQTRRWAARTSPGEDDPRLMEAYASIQPEHRRGVTLRIIDTLDVPTLAGVFYPQIWMPRSWLGHLNARELRCVLLHELGHARRHDLLAQWFCSLACCVHWFNPLVWVAARLARADRELACDAWVLEQGAAPQDEGFPTEYGNTLLKIVEQLREPTRLRHSPASVAMAAGKRNLSLRVREIGAFQPAPAWRGIMAIGVAAAIVAVLTVSHAAPAPEKPEPPPVPSPVAPTPEPSPAADAPPPAASPAASPANQQQLEVEAKIVALTKSAVRQLKEQEAQLPGQTELIERLAASFSEKGAGSDASPATSPVSQVLSASESHNFLQRLSKLEGVDVLSAPRITAKPDQKATIEIIREYLYPDKLSRADVSDINALRTPENFEKKNLGLTLSVEGGILPARNAIDLKVSWQWVELQGYVRPRNGKPIPVGNSIEGNDRPVFSTQVFETFVTMPPGATLVLGSLRRNPGAWAAVDGSLKILEEEAIILNLMTVRIIDAPPQTSGGSSAAPAKAAGAAPTSKKGGNPSPSPAPGAAASPSSSPAAYPYGIPVPGKPGLITSPYAPDSGYIDVRGYEPGQEVKDPYTGKMFLVP